MSEQLQADKGDVRGIGWGLSDQKQHPVIMKLKFEDQLLHKAGLHDLSVLIFHQTFLILQRCHSGFILEHPAEIVLTAEAASAADLANG